MQPNTSSGDFAADKVIGILVILRSVCGICGGLALVGLGGLIGGLGAAGAAGTNNTADGAAAATAVAGAGGIALLIGVLILGLAIASLIGAIGVLKSQRKGFNLLMIVSGISLLISIVSLVALQGGVQSIVGMVIDAAVLYYSWGRLNGKIGPNNLV